MKLSEHKEHLIYAGALLAITLIFLHAWIEISSHTLGDLVVYFYPRAEMLEQSVKQYGDFLPLWNPYIFAGSPLHAKSAFFNIFTIPGILIFILGPLGALKWTVIIDVFLSGLFMYILMNELVKKPKAAFIAALVYMFNGYFLFTAVKAELLESANAYPFIPLVLFFLIKAFREISIRDTIVHSVFAGMALFMLLLGSGGPTFLYTTLILVIYFALYPFGKNIPERIKKILIVGVIFSIVFLGLIAFKLIPFVENHKLESRNYLPWEMASTRTFAPQEFFRELVEPSVPKLHQEQSNKIGIIAFILLLIGLATMPRNRYWIFFIVLIAVALLLTTGSFLLRLLWEHYPGWEGMRYANRALVIFVFAASCIAAYGAKTLLEWVKTRYANPRAELIAFVLLALLIIADLAVLGVGGAPNTSTGQQKLSEAIKQNEALQYIAQQPGIFRVHTYETKGIDWGTEFYTVPLHVEPIFGYDSEWNSDYLNIFLSHAVEKPETYMAMLNVKYITAQHPIEIEGFELVKEFGHCTICFPEQQAIQKAWGPYVYENKNVVSRAHLTNNAILIIGDARDSLRIAYSIMKLNAFDPKKSVIIIGGNLNRYTDEELNSINTLVLLTATGDDLNRLRNYRGKIYPDVLNGATSLTIADIEERLSLGEYIPIPDENIRTVSFDKKIVTVPDYDGYLVMSEKYAMYSNGWNAYSGQEEKRLELAQAVLSAVRIKHDREITFEYAPASVKQGLLISALTSIGLALFFAYVLFDKRKKENKEQKEQNERT